MKTLFLILVAVIVLSVYFYYDVAPADAPAEVTMAELDEITKSPAPAIPVPVQTALFENGDYNFGFKYRNRPYGYSLFENTPDQNIDMGTLFGVTLIRSDDYNESVKAAAAGNAHDGPPAMSVYVFSASKILDLSAWLVGNKMITNCMEGELTNTTLAGADALVCLWDGLYPGVTIAQIRDNKIYVLVGARESLETETGLSYKKDFDELLESFEVGN